MVFIPALTYELEVGIKTRLLLRAADGIVDLAVPGRTVDVINSVPVATNISKFGGKSFQCTGGYLSIPDKDFPFEPADFTLEAWVYPVALTDNQWFFSKGDGVSSCLKTYTSSLYLQTRQRSVNGARSMIPVNQWSHFAITRRGDVYNFWLNGASRMTVTDTAPGWGNTSAALRVGGYEGSSSAYWDQIRVSNFARYTGAFTPPTTAFELD